MRSGSQYTHVSCMLSYSDERRSEGQPPAAMTSRPEVQGLHVDQLALLFPYVHNSSGSGVTLGSLLHALLAWPTSHCFMRLAARWQPAVGCSITSTCILLRRSWLFAAYTACPAVLTLFHQRSRMVAASSGVSLSKLPVFTLVLLPCVSQGRNSEFVKASDEINQSLTALTDERARKVDEQDQWVQQVGLSSWELCPLTPLTVFQLSMRLRSNSLVTYNHLPYERAE